MAYTPKTWVCGETITANGLNNIEEGVQEALECCDHGYECYDAEVTKFEGSVESATNMGGGAYLSDVIISTDDLQNDQITVVFNGTEYEVPKRTFIGTQYYGATFTGGFLPSAFEECPFCIIDFNGFKLAVPQSGTNTIKVTAIESVVETDECFDEAVKKHLLKNIADYGETSIIEGSLQSNVASGRFAHAEGGGTTASGDQSHAEGWDNYATGSSSHAEGGSSHADGMCSHAEGGGTTASGQMAHAQNYSTTAQGFAQTAIGINNVPQGNSDSNVSTDYAFIIGNGVLGQYQSNALAIKWDGTFVFANGTEITPAQFASLLALL